MLTIHANKPKGSTTIIDVNGNTAELSEAVRVLTEPGWDQGLISSGLIATAEQMQTQFAVENSMIAEFKHDFEATQEELLSQDEYSLLRIKPILYFLACSFALLERHHKTQQIFVLLTVHSTSHFQYEKQIF